MYKVCACIYTVWTCICNVCAWYILPNQYKHTLDLTSCSNRRLMTDSEALKEAALKERSLRWAETRLRRKADPAWWEVECGCGGCEAVQPETCLYYVHTHIYNHKRICTMYIHNFTFINMYVHTTYIYIYSCTCTYTFILQVGNTSHQLSRCK